MQRIILFLVILPFTACGDPEDFLDALAGHKYDVVVLIKEPTVLDKTSLTLRPPTTMKVVGEISSVCLALADNVEPSADEEKQFEAAMGGAAVNISAKLVSGDIVTFSEPLTAWRRKGRILGSNELSGCASACCAYRKKMVKGVEIKEVTIVSDKPLKVQGVFWESTNAFDGLEKK